MKFTNIHSADLPTIDNSIKECVNSGQWTLFKTGDSNEYGLYFLKTGREVYALDSSGRVMETFPLNVPKNMTEIFYFEDLPKPSSLSNRI